MFVFYFFVKKRRKRATKAINSEMRRFIFKRIEHRAMWKKFSFSVHCHMAHKSQAILRHFSQRSLKVDENFHTQTRKGASKRSFWIIQIRNECKCLPDGNPHRRVLIVVAHLSKVKFPSSFSLSPALLIFTMFFLSPRFRFLLWLSSCCHCFFLSFLLLGRNEDF
jgi:hypothetical protein